MEYDYNQEEQELQILDKEEHELQIRAKEEYELKIRAQEEQELQILDKEEHELQIRAKEERELKILERRGKQVTNLLERVELFLLLAKRTLLLREEEKAQRLADHEEEQRLEEEDEAQRLADEDDEEDAREAAAFRSAYEFNGHPVNATTARMLGTSSCAKYIAKPAMYRVVDHGNSSTDEYDTHPWEYYDDDEDGVNPYLFVACGKINGPRVG